MAFARRLGTCTGFRRSPFSQFLTLFCSPWRGISFPVPAHLFRPISISAAATRYSTRRGFPPPPPPVNDSERGRHARTMTTSAFCAAPALRRVDAPRRISSAPLRRPRISACAYSSRLRRSSPASPTGGPTRPMRAAADRAAPLEGGGYGAGSASGGGSGGGGGEGRGGEDADGGPWRPWLWPLWGLRWYLAALECAPLKTKIVTSSLLGAGSDLLAQAIDSGVEGVRWRRVMAMAAVGAVLTAPMFHFLYEVLEGTLPVAGAVRRRNLALQLLVDQGVAGPVWLVAFFGVLDTMESGRVRVAEIGKSLRRDFFTSLKLTWAVYPALQLVSFAYLPSNMRVLWMGLIDFWYVSLACFTRKCRLLCSPSLLTQLEFRLSGISSNSDFFIPSPRHFSPYRYTAALSYIKHN